MSTKKQISRVDRAFATFKRIYEGLELAEQRELDQRLRECRWFGTFGKLRTVFEMPSDRHTIEYLKQMHSARSRAPNTDGLDDDVIRLRDAEKSSFGDIASYITDRTGNPCTYDRARKR
jgi:hypothetical protein